MKSQLVGETSPV